MLGSFSGSPKELSVSKLCRKTKKAVGRYSHLFICCLFLATPRTGNQAYAAAAGRTGALWETFAPLAVRADHVKGPFGLLAFDSQSKSSSGRASDALPAERGGHFLGELYFYPIVTNDSFLHEFDPDWIVKDATVRFPRVEEMSGVSIIIYWAQLCPVKKRCNFAMIDQILAYWGKLGKKVVLCVSTMGAPIERFHGDHHEFVSATPDWVLKETATFQSDSNNFIGIYGDWKDMAKNPRYKFVFPRYDDSRFVREVKKLVDSLGERYDGNPAIAYMRIGIGKSGEDNPYGRVGMAWFTNHLWINFSREVTQYYLASFHKTRLEFDVLWTGIVVAGAKTATPITPNEQKEAQEFIDYVASKNIFIAFNGISNRPTKNAVPGATAANPAGTCAGYSPRPDETTAATDAAPLAQIERLKQKGIAFGLEGNALTDPCMAPSRISALLEWYKPERFIFFGDAAAVISFHREGMNDNNRYEIDHLTNVLVPWTSKAEFSAHQAEALPRIKQFAAEIEQLVRRSVLAGQ
jgi:hypothetical protein